MDIYEEIRVVPATGKSIRKKKSSEKYSFIFDGGNLSLGVYFYSLFVDEVRVDSKKCYLLNE